MVRAAGSVPQQRRQYIGVDQEHQKSSGREGKEIRSNAPSLFTRSAPSAAVRVRSPSSSISSGRRTCSLTDDPSGVIVVGHQPASPDRTPSTGGPETAR